MSNVPMDEQSSHEDLNSQWHDRWQNNLIGFHVDEIQPWLQEHWPVFTQTLVSTQQSVFVPLCGKTLDIEYFLLKGFNVVACELSEMAVQQLFEQLAITPSINKWTGGTIYSGNHLTVYVGDFFKLSKQELASIDYIYDRAALIALPQQTRSGYMNQLKTICPNAKQFIITLDYDQSVKQGPPYAVSEQEIHRQYSSHFHVKRVEHEDIIEKEPRFKKRGITSLYESLYWLEPIAN